MARLRSAELLIGGRKVSGISVNPNGLAAVIGVNTALMKGGPMGSTAMIALTSVGRASARIHPNWLDCECVRRMTGFRVAVKAKQADSSECTYTDQVQ